MKISRLSKPVKSMIVLTLLAAGVFFIQSVGDRDYAQPLAADLVKADVGKVLIDPADTIILLLDHQAGLFQTVKDISVAELRTNTIILAKVANMMKIPVITTACVYPRAALSRRGAESRTRSEDPVDRGLRQAGRNRTFRPM